MLELFDIFLKLGMFLVIFFAVMAALIMLVPCIGSIIAAYIQLQEKKKTYKP